MNRIESRIDREREYIQEICNFTQTTRPILDSSLQVRLVVEADFNVTSAIVDRCAKVKTSDVKFETCNVSKCSENGRKQC